MKTLPKTIAAAFALTLMAAGTATGSVEQDANDPSLKLEAALGKDASNKELAQISLTGENENEIDLVAEELKARLNLK